MAKWGKKIELAVNLLSAVAEEFPEDEAEDLIEMLNGINECVASAEFKSFSADEKNVAATEILYNAVRLCQPSLTDLHELISPSPPARNMTVEEAAKCLHEEYASAISSGDDDILGMNIGEWLEERGIVVVPESEESESQDDKNEET